MPTEPAIQSGEPEQIYGAALLLHRQGRLVEAERLYETVLQRDAGHFPALYNLGLVRLLRGDTEAAAGLLQRALERNPGFAEGHNALAIALRAQGRLDEALGHFEKALAIDPDLAEPHNNYAATLLAGAIRRPVLVALGLRRDGKKEIIDFHDAIEHQHPIALLERAGMKDGDHRVELLCDRAYRRRADRSSQDWQQRLAELAH